MSAPVPHTARMVPHMKARPGVISGSTLRGGAGAGKAGADRGRTRKGLQQSP